MKSQKIQEMSSEDLLKRKKLAITATSALAGLLTVLLIMALFLCFRKGLSVGLPFLIICFSLSPIVVINFINVRAVQKELQARNQAF